ncbi:MAG: response regulator [Deltaproteobacteria bacterium]|nr:response regulator [Deltaproteobacteria bacterium]
MIPFSLVLEILAVLVVLGVTTLYWRLGRSSGLQEERGWNAILIGFLLLLLGTVVDVTDHFDSLSRFVILGRTGVQSLMEKVVGFIGGFLFIAIGLNRWLPHIAARRKAEKELRRAHDELERRVEERTHELSERSEQLELEISERKKIQDDLRFAKEVAEEANRAKSQFLANMSHELRSPLNAVIGFSNVLLKNKAENLRPEDLRFLDRIRANGEHLLILINEILDLSKVESGRVELAQMSIDPRILVHETLAQLKGQVAEGKVLLRARLPMRSAPLYTDPVKLKQVLINLVSNAVKFTQRGEISVALRVERGSYRPLTLEVRDTGVGIAPDRLENIFEAFEQGDAGTARRFGGTGLGLSISRSLCDLMGYTLGVSSQEGEGSVFFVHLTADAGLVEVESHQDQLFDSAEIDTVVNPLPSSRAGSLVGRKILVVDDGADSRILLVNLVEETGAQALVAASGEEGLRMARRHQPDLITLDLRMPHMTGWEVLANLKSEEKLASIPVVVVSIEAAEGRGAIFGAVDVLHKPVASQELLAVVKRYCLEAKGEILVLDDEESQRKLVAAELEAQGFQVTTASSGTEALELMRRRRPDLVLLDLLMPEMDGTAFLRQARRDPRFHGLPVVVVTARDLSAKETLLVEQGVRAMLPKGEDLGQQLVETLEEILYEAPGSPADSLADSSDSSPDP